MSGELGEADALTVGQWVLTADVDRRALPHQDLACDPGDAVLQIAGDGDIAAARRNVGGDPLAGPDDPHWIEAGFAATASINFGRRLHSIVRA